MNYSLAIVLFFAAAAMNLQAATRSSANYSIATDTIDLGGAKAQSANYSLAGTTIGQPGTGSAAVTNSAAYVGKDGYVGQLYDLVSLSITLPPSTSLNETASRQLVATPLADDTSMSGSLNPSTVSWSIIGGPIASISSSGLLTAANVYQDTGATAGGSAAGLSGQLSLTILNVTNDDYGTYAGDGIDDTWQVQYFGQPPNPLAGPNADADGTGQNNLFKFVAGLNPIDGSRFTTSLARVTAQPGQMQFSVQPIVADRTYLPQETPSLTSPNWQPISSFTQMDNGSTRTYTDPNALPAPRFYRVQITKP